VISEEVASIPGANLAAANGRLNGKVAMVVGGGGVGDASYPGTGEATARLLAAAGASVSVVGRSKEHTQRTVDLIVEAGGVAQALLGDVSKSAICDALMEEAVDAYGRLDVLVNNIGVSLGSTVMESTDEDWERAFAINLGAPIAMTRAAVPHFQAAGAGSIINIGAAASVQSSGSAPYETTKAGLVALTRAMAFELGAAGIRANCVAPGHLFTPIASGRSGKGRELRRRLSPLGVEGNGWDCGWAVLYLASDESRYVTGQLFMIDGGVAQQSPQAIIIRLGLLEALPD
jgi:NAD(P)-dependent dehydrogenase (short-subunit alcohol dehydrogenase family)